ARRAAPALRRGLRRRRRRRGRGPVPRGRGAAGGPAAPGRGPLRGPVPGPRGEHHVDARDARVPASELAPDRRRRRRALRRRRPRRLLVPASQRVRGPPRVRRGAAPGAPRLPLQLRPPDRRGPAAAQRRDDARHRAAGGRRGPLGGVVGRGHPRPRARRRPGGRGDPDDLWGWLRARAASRAAPRGPHAHRGPVGRPRGVRRERVCPGRRRRGLDGRRRRGLDVGRRRRLGGKRRPPADHLRVDLRPPAGQHKRAKFPTSKAHISAGFHSPPGPRRGRVRLRRGHREFARRRGARAALDEQVGDGEQLRVRRRAALRRVSVVRGQARQFAGLRDGHRAHPNLHGHRGRRRGAVQRARRVAVRGVLPQRPRGEERQEARVARRRRTRGRGRAARRAVAAAPRDDREPGAGAPGRRPGHRRHLRARRRAPLRPPRLRGPPPLSGLRQRGPRPRPRLCLRLPGRGGAERDAGRRRARGPGRRRRADDVVSESSV
ncbi:hypothetical protein AURANDRAFT_72631, partial [Aureococcus anophagefferens]